MEILVSGHCCVIFSYIWYEANDGIIIELEKYLKLFQFWKCLPTIGVTSVKSKPLKYLNIIMDIFLYILSVLILYYII